MLPIGQMNGSPYRLPSYRWVINLSGKDLSLLHAPYPERQSSIQAEVSENGPERPIFGLVPS